MECPSEVGVEKLGSVIEKERLVKFTPVMNKILVGNLSSETTEILLRKLFSATAGVIVSVAIPFDPKTNKHRGYAFVEMESGLQAQQAVTDLNGASMDGRAIVCTIVEPPAKRKWFNIKVW